MDKGGDDKARVGNQRGQDLAKECPTRSASISLATRSDLTIPTGGTANGMWARAPSKKSMQRLKAKVRELLVPSNNEPWQDVRDTLNRTLRGWSNYFWHGRGGQHSAASTSMSASVCALSSSGGTKWQGAAITGSHSKCCIGSTACCAWNACHECHAVYLAVKPSRRAGCRSSARPVR